LNEADQPANTDDFTLMRRIAARNADALSMLYERHASILYGICCKIVGNDIDAEQILIDVFAEAWERADRYDSARGAPLTYLITLIRSRAIDHLRTKPKSIAKSIDSIPPGQLADSSIDPLERSSSDEYGMMVRAAVENLDPEQRQAIQLAFYEGCSHSQIAERLARPLGTIKSHIRQGLIQIRDSLRTQWRKGSKER
jgi:RNA polymerase sigma-70 factor (ECF subfamily)